MAFNLLNTLRGVNNALKPSSLIKTAGSVAQAVSPANVYRQSSAAGAKVGAKLNVPSIVNTALRSSAQNMIAAQNPIAGAVVSQLKAPQVKSLAGTPTAPPPPSTASATPSWGTKLTTIKPTEPATPAGVLGSAPTATSSSGSTSYGDSGFSAPLPPISAESAPPTPTPTVPSATAPAVPSAQSKSVIDQLREKVTSLSAPTAEEQALQDQLAQFRGDAAQGIAGLEGQGRGIPLALIRGQQSKLNTQAQLQEQTLLDRIAASSAQRQAQLAAAKNDYDMAAQEQERQDKLTAPMSVGGNVLRLNPTTGQYETVYSAPVSQDYPAAVQEYEYAKAQGYAGSFLDYEAEKGGSTTKAPTTAQSAAAIYANRLTQAEDTLANNKFFLDIRYNTPMAEFLKSEDRKLAEQAEANFINAVLRRESGAAIAPSEFASARKQYIPQPGDTQAVLDQKKANRQIVQQGLQNEAAQAAFSPTGSTGGITNIDSFLDSFSNAPSTAVNGSKATGAVAAKALAQNYPVGSWGNQCGAFTNRIAGTKMGNSYASKMTFVNPAIGRSEPVQPGDFFVMPYKQYGHTGFIDDKPWIPKPDGSYDIPVIDSNWNLDEKVARHYINSKKMSGFGRKPLPTGRVSLS